MRFNEIKKWLIQEKIWSFIGVVIIAILAIFTISALNIGVNINSDQLNLIIFIGLMVLTVVISSGLVFQLSVKHKH